MNTNRRLRYFLSGAATALLLTSLLTGALAYTGTRTAQLTYSDIKVALDGESLDLADATGAEVEPFAINGTTYLPVRAISQALGFQVAWNGDSHTVYITRDAGEQPPLEGERVSMTGLNPYAIPFPEEDGTARFTDGGSFTNRQTAYHPDNSLYMAAGSSVLGWMANQVPGSLSVTYLVGGDYRQFTAWAASVDGQGATTFRFCDADTGTELKSVTVKAGEAPVQVTVDLTGVDKLRISGTTRDVRIGQSVYHRAYLNGALYNAYLIK